MAKKRSIPSNLALHKKAYQTVAYHGVPMWRCQAWALFDYEMHGGHLVVSSGDRRKGVAERFGHMSQQALWDCFQAKVRTGVCPAHCHGNCLPANRPGFSSHELRSDGMAFYKAPRGAKIADYMLGLDCEAPGTGSAARLVAWLNSHGYHAARIYHTTAEAHHFSFSKSPATHARWRLTRWLATGK